MRGTQSCSQGRQKQSPILPSLTQLHSKSRVVKRADKACPPGARSSGGNMHGGQRGLPERVVLGVGREGCFQSSCTFRNSGGEAGKPSQWAALHSGASDPARRCPTASQIAQVAVESWGRAGWASPDPRGLAALHTSSVCSCPIVSLPHPQSLPSPPTLASWSPGLKPPFPSQVFLWFLSRAKTELHQNSNWLHKSQRLVGFFFLQICLLQS